MLKDVPLFDSGTGSPARACHGPYVYALTGCEGVSELPVDVAGAGVEVRGGLRDRFVHSSTPHHSCNLSTRLSQSGGR